SGVAVAVGVGVGVSVPAALAVPVAVGVAVGVLAACVEVSSGPSPPVAKMTMAITAMSAAMPRKPRRWFRLMRARLESPEPTLRRDHGCSHRPRALGRLHQRGPR